MILETLAMVGCLAGAYTLNNQEDIKNRKIENNIKNKWNKLMDSIGNKSENKIEQKYEILKIIRKNYGFDVIIGLPIGLDCNEFRKLIPSIQQLYMGDVIAEPSKDKKNTIYMRVHESDKNISDKDKIRFEWYRYFHTGNKFRNAFGETYIIDSISPIKDLNKDEIGYKLSISIPSQLNYSDLDNAVDDLSKVLNKCFITYNNESKKAECDVITKAIDNNYKFTPIKKLKAWQLYVGMGYDYKPIILDYKVVPNCLIGGVVGSGKTVSLIMAFVNLCVTRNDFDLYIGMMSEKEDLRILQNVKQCKRYCNSPAETIKLLEDLNKEMDRRNKLFAKCKEYCSNIYKYNSLVSNDKKLKIIHFISDEVADLMEYSESQDLLWNLIRKSRSAGIYITLASQRATINNMSPEIKAQLGNKICFNQSNSASALSILSGEGLAKRAVSLEKSREFIADYTGGISIGKTLYLSEDMMVDLLKDVQKPVEIEEKQPKSSKKSNKPVKKEEKAAEVRPISFKNING